MGFVSFRREEHRRGLCIGLPSRCLPSSGFFTLSTVCSHRGRVALFRATPAHRISAFRAFPAQPAVAPLDAHCSLAVESAPAWAVARFDLCPQLRLPLQSSSAPVNHPPGCLCDLETVADISHETRRRTSKLNDERPTPAPSANAGRSGGQPTGSASDQRSRLRRARTPTPEPCSG
jgi:hypothetical protein